MYKKQVRKFYQKIWNEYDKSVIPEVLHEAITFRGSLGLEKQGHEGFIEYLDWVHNALDDYTCEIDDWVEEGNKVFAWMIFSGFHKNEFLGYPATYRRVRWNGCALFTFEEGRIIDLRVLGDLKGLEEQLCQAPKR